MSGAQRHRRGRGDPARTSNARAELYTAAREGLGASFTWLDGEEVPARNLVLDRLLPLAKAGLTARASTRRTASATRISRAGRIRTMHTGLDGPSTPRVSYMKDRGTQGALLTALTAAMIARQKTDAVVADWEPARLDE
ncbi:MAG: hypothetical protein IPF99_19895 [Deltaproteobacteria bacterium]|nr:hypothetical protein [Deltaproteobacteria bacterium]